MEWAYRRPFDFVFGRMLVASIGDWPKFIRQSFDNLNSGGWIELQDIVSMPKCDDGTMSDDSAIKIYGDRVMECCDILKRYGDSALRYKQQMIDAGFINVTEVKYKWPTNPWPAEKHYQELGMDGVRTTPSTNANPEVSEHRLLDLPRYCRWALWFEYGCLYTLSRMVRGTS